MMFNSFDMKKPAAATSAPEATPVETKARGLFDSITAKIFVGPEKKEVTLKEDDVIPSITIAKGNYGDAYEEVLTDVTVIGFTMRKVDTDKVTYRGFDGVATDVVDAAGDRRFMMIQDACEVRDIVVGIVVEDGESYSKRILVDNIIDIDDGTDAEDDDDSSDDENP